MTYFNTEEESVAVQNASQSRFIGSEGVSLSPGDESVRKK
jgi:hypothetical protein